MGSEAHLEVFVTELKLEPEGAHAVACARSLWQDLSAGHTLAADQVRTLLEVVGRSTDAAVRNDVIRALTVQALRADGGAILEGIATLGGEPLRTSLGADVRVPIGPRALAAWLSATAGREPEVQQKLANRLRNGLFAGADISAAGPRLVSQLGIAPRGSGARRVVVSAAASECIFAALTQDNPPRQKSDTVLGSTDRSRDAGTRRRARAAAVAGGRDRERWRARARRSQHPDRRRRGEGAVGRGRRPRPDGR